MKTLDLHGMNKDESLLKVDAFLHKYSHLKQIKIMTGKGSGVLHKAVVAYLKSAHYPWSYEKLKNGSPNHGVLVVHLD